jgi:hypothetical protein
MRTAIVALFLSLLPLAAAAQSATVDPPSKADILRWMEAPPGAMIYNYSCRRLDHRSFDCGFDMPPESVTRHIEIRAVWVGTDWSFTLRQ